MGLGGREAIILLWSGYLSTITGKALDVEVMSKTYALC